MASLIGAAFKKNQNPYSVAPSSCRSAILSDLRSRLPGLAPGTAAAAAQEPLALPTPPLMESASVSVAAAAADAATAQAAVAEWGAADVVAWVRTTAGDGLARVFDAKGVVGSDLLEVVEEDRHAFAPASVAAGGRVHIPCTRKAAASEPCKHAGSAAD